MTDETTTPDLDPDAPEEIVPDYSRVGFRQLQALCKTRGIPADGRAPDLIDKLKAYDAQHGLAVDTDVPDADEDEVDLLADDMPAQPDSTPTQSTAHPLDAPTSSRADEPARTTANDATPESPAGDGRGASLPSPVGTPTQGSPAVTTLHAEPGTPALPPSMVRSGRPNLAVRDGIVKVGEGHGAAEVRAFRREYPIGQRDISDVDHARFIEDTHRAAWAAGLQTKGGVTIGERVGYATDANSQRTAIYQVPLKRQK
jgi:hypothetical protein